MKVERMHLRLVDLRFYARHGVLPQERVVGGEYLVNVDLAYMPLSAALQGDELAGTVNYAEVLSAVRAEMERPAALLEHLAWRLAQSLLAQFVLVQAVTITIRKVCPPMGMDGRGAEVSLTATRGRDVN